MGATSPVSQHQTGQQINQHLIGQQMSQNSFYQTSRRDFLSQGQKGFYSSGQYGGATYTDAALLKQSQLSALYTWETNGIYLVKVHSETTTLFLMDTNDDHGLYSLLTRLFRVVGCIEMTNCHL